MNDQALLRLGHAHAPCYVYDAARIDAQAETLRRTFSGYTALFSIKANPFLPLVRRLAAHGIGADAASAAEVGLAHAAGMPDDDIYYSAAGKTDDELGQTLGCCTIIADSLGELERIARIAHARGQTARVGVRINPAFTMDGPGAVPAKYGVDERLLPALADMERRHAECQITGIHVHVRSQVLDGKKLSAYYAACFSLARRVADALGHGLDFVNFGGGVGIAYDEAVEQPLPMDVLADAAAGVARENAHTLNARLLVESGRFLTCAAGTYLTRVLDMKESYGKTFAIVQNGLNGFLRPVVTEMLGTLAPDSPDRAYEPFYTGRTACPVRVLGTGAGEKRVDIVGNLCAATDVLAAGLPVRDVRVGDIVAVGNAGSYAYTLSPLLFSNHPAPKQLLVLPDGSVLSQD